MCLRDSWRCEPLILWKLCGPGTVVQGGRDSAAGRAQRLRFRLHPRAYETGRSRAVRDAPNVGMTDGSVSPAAHLESRVNVEVLRVRHPFPRAGVLPDVCEGGARGVGAALLLLARVRQHCRAKTGDGLQATQADVRRALLRFPEVSPGNAVPGRFPSSFLTKLGMVVPLPRPVLAFHQEPPLLVDARGTESPTVAGRAEWSLRDRLQLTTRCQRRWRRVPVCVLMYWSQVRAWKLRHMQCKCKPYPPKHGAQARRRSLIANEPVNDASRSGKEIGERRTRPSSQPEVKIAEATADANAALRVGQSSVRSQNDLYFPTRSDAQSINMQFTGVWMRLGSEGARRAADERMPNGWTETRKVRQFGFSSPQQTGCSAARCARSTTVTFRGRINSSGWAPDATRGRKRTRHRQGEGRRRQRGRRRRRRRSARGAWTARERTLTLYWRKSGSRRKPP